MKPPNSDGQRPGSPAGATGAGVAPAAEPSRPTPSVLGGASGDAARSQAGAVEATGTPAQTGGSTSAPRKDDAPKTEPVRAEAAKVGSSKVETFKVETSKAEPSKVEPPDSDALKPEPVKSDPGKSGTFSSGPQTTPRPVTGDGPIIDLKANRLPDRAAAKPTAAAAASVKPAAAKPADGEAPGGKPSSAPLSPDKPSPGTEGSARPSGSGTPRITPAAPAARGPGFGSVAAAGLLGGVLGAGLLYAVERSGALGGTFGGVDESRITALDQRIATLAPRDALAALDTRIGANEAALKPLPEAVRTAEAAAREALQKAAAAPAADAAAATAAPSAAVTAPALPPDLAARLDSLDQRLSALQEEPGREQQGDARVAAMQAGSTAAQDDLGKRLAALQGDVESRTRANAEAGQALGQKLAALQQALDGRVQAATEAVQAAGEASRQAVEAGRAQAAEAAKAAERRFQAQAEKIDGLDKAVAGRADAASVQATLRVVSADRIATALATGAPYAEALAALRTTEPGDPARLTAVAAFADKGAPTAASLAAEFRPIAERIAAARKAAQARSVAETGDVGQRLMSMAESIVQVRKVDAPAPAPSESGGDPVAKLQESLDRGALAEAAQAFAALPDPVRAQAGEFGAKLVSRAAAGDAARALLADAFKALPAIGVSR